MDTNDAGTARLYGGLVAVVSGSYSLWQATTGTAMSSGAWLMVLLGLVVVIHGLLLFVTPNRLAGDSGPLMVVWSVLMLLNQLWLWSMAGTPMDGGMGGGMESEMSGAMAAMGADPGMVAVAVIMLGSGVIMWTTGDEAGEM